MSNKTPWFECQVREDSVRHVCNNGHQFVIHFTVALYFYFGKIVNSEIRKVSTTSGDFPDAALAPLCDAMREKRWNDFLTLLNKLDIES